MGTRWNFRPGRVASVRRRSCVQVCGGGPHLWRGGLPGALDALVNARHPDTHRVERQVAKRPSSGEIDGSEHAAWAEQLGCTPQCGYLVEWWREATALTMSNDPPDPGCSSAPVGLTSAHLTLESIALCQQVVDLPEASTKLDCAWLPSIAATRRSFTNR